MLEQWFLDLDGVRSGPYQTSEVMSLVAEGEVLPHHLISTELKSQNWTTILEWRLAQNKMVPPKATSTPIVEDTPPVADVSNPSPSTESITYEIPPDSKIEVEVPVKEPIIEQEQPKTPERIKAPDQAMAQPVAKPAPSGRDPMAEMFDMLQNSKQKREQKNQQHHQPAPSPQTNAAPTPSAPTIQTKTTTSGSSGEWLKLAVGGIIVIIIGFALGQYFQKANRTESTAQSQPAPTSAPKPAPTTPEPIREVVDRTNEKITIKSHVPVSQANQISHAKETHNEDIQDIKDLKKELMELKALKEEIRNNADDEPVRNDAGNGRGNLVNPIDPTQPGSQPAENTAEPANPDGEAATKDGQDIHY